MGVAIQCMLNREVHGFPLMEGKSLAAAFCGQAGDTPGEEPSNVLTLRFGDSSLPPTSGKAASEPLLTPLDQFIAGDQDLEWHDASAGLAAVRDILEKFHNGAKVIVASDFEFFDGDDEELTSGVIRDLENLEKILTVAEQAGARFYLVFSI